MAVQKQQRTAAKKQTGTVQAKANKAAQSKAATKKAAVPRARTTKLVSGVAGEGLEKFLAAAACELEAGSKRIAKKLRVKSEAGDTKSTKLLLELASLQTVERGAKAESVALEIAAAPEWKEAGGQGASREEQEATDAQAEEGA